MNWVGQSVGRVEDQRLLRGVGRFTADIDLPDQGHAVFRRSDIASGRLRAIRIDKAEALDGVRFVTHALRGDQLGLGRFPTLGEMPGQRTHRRPVMPTEIRHVGEILAMVVADDRHIAEHALDLIEIDIEPQVDDRLECAYRWQHGDFEQAKLAFAKAKWIADVSASSNRIIVHPMETRAALAEWDPRHDRLTLYTPSQGVHKIRDMLAPAIGLCPSQIHVITPDVGGAFGIKLQAYPEQALVAVAARATGRPVKWSATRQEASLMDAHGRAQELRARLAVGEDGKFLALDIINQADLGAYATGFGAMTPSLSGGKVAGHTYQIPTITMQVQAVYSNRVPVDAYRGAGKPDMVYIVERAIEEAARLSEVDRVDLRRRNLIASDRLPYTLPLGQKIDSGDFQGLLDRVIEASDWVGFASRREQAARQGKLAGIGLGLHMHVSGGFVNERSALEVRDNKVIVDTGAQAGGQGHETLFAQIVASRLQLHIDQIQLRQGDTQYLADGGGTGGSSSLPIAGVNIDRAASCLLEMAKKRASDHLEAAETDLAYVKGVFQVIGTDRQISIFEIANRDELSFGCDFDGDSATFPNGAYVAEVEIDKETGKLSLKRFTGVDDIGVVFNPLIAMGQIHGGVVQGLGQAMLEFCAYDQSGQLLNTSLMDYALPRADDVIQLDCEFQAVPASANPLGAKGAGELGTAGAMAPVVHAVLDALRDFPVHVVDMPLTSEQLWRIIHQKNDGNH